MRRCIGSAGACARSCAAVTVRATDMSAVVRRIDSSTGERRGRAVADRFPDMKDSMDERVRIDKWLWAARFFKTRSLATDAVDGGKVEVNGESAKPSKLVKAGDEIRLRL